MKTIKELYSQGLIHPPDFVAEQCQYLTIMGSFAYGVSSDSSDVDLYGFCIPDRKIVFPHEAGIVPGFGEQGQKFEVWQEHHVHDPSELGGEGRTYDFQVYSIIKYFDLCMGNNPNMIDSLFTAQRCVLHCTQIGDLVRQNRKMFLHKGAFHRFKGYAFSQLHKIETKNPTGKRKEQLDESGIDRKYLYHLVRLVNECEQILIEGDLDLDRNREQLKAIRRGEQFTGITDIYEWFNNKEAELETLYNNCTILPYKPDENKIKELLLNCLEMHFGSIEKAVARNDKYERAVDNIKRIINKI